MIFTEMKFYSESEGGYKSPIDVWPARIMLRFEEEPGMNYGALVYPNESTSISPGSKLNLQLKMMDDSSEGRLLRPGVTFKFGDIKDRGVGRVLSNDVEL